MSFKLFHQYNYYYHLQLSNLEGAYDKFRQANPRVGYFIVKLEGDNVTLLTLKESDKASNEDKKVSVHEYESKCA